MKLITALIASSALIGLVAAPAGAAEPNEGFTTATGPLTAGKTFKASLETINDSDFHFFYIPDPVQVSVTTINAAKKGKDAAERRGRTIVSSLLRARKGKLPLPLPESLRTLAPGKRATVQITLVPGKYFIPVGRAPNGSEPQPNIPFRLRINPIGSTTDSYEIFERRCKDALRRVKRIKSSKKNTARKLAKANRRDASKREIRVLRERLRSKRSKIDEAQRIKRIVCSVPQ